jgi:hypothetical protein
MQETGNSSYVELRDSGKSSAGWQPVKRMPIPQRIGGLGPTLEYMVKAIRKHWFVLVGSWSGVTALRHFPHRGRTKTKVRGRLLA